MKTFITGTILLAGLAVTAPAMAQGIYIGPGGVGVGTGSYGYDRGYRDHGDRDYRRDGNYEGRSVYREHRRSDYNDRY